MSETNALISKQITEETTPESLVSSVNEAIKAFCLLEEKEAKDTLTKLKLFNMPKEEGVKSDETLEDWLKRLHLEGKGVTATMLRFIALELEDAYKVEHSECWLNANVKELYPIELCTEFNNDPTILAFVSNLVKAASLFSNHIINKITLLLFSTENSLIYWGLREMNFPKSEISFFSPHAVAIGRYLNILTNTQETNIISPPASTNAPVLREKTITRLLKQDNLKNKTTDEIIAMVRNAIALFNNLPEEKAFAKLLLLKMLQKVTVENDEASEKQLRDALNSVSLGSVEVQNLLVICTELSNKYKAKHPNCWLSEEFDYIPKALSDMVIRDKTLLKCIDIRCKESKCTKEAIKSISLTESNDVSLRFIALKHIGFSNIESKYFIPSAKEIVDYFLQIQEQREEKERKEKENTTKEVVEAEEIKEEEEKIESVEKAVETEENQKESTSISAEEILKNSAIISEFLTAFKTLESKKAELIQAGINPEIITKKEALITPLLEIASKF